MPSLNKYEVTGIFLIKLLWGFLFAWVHFKYYDGGDTFYYFEKSGVLFNSIHQSVWDYIRLVFGPTFHQIPVELKEYAFNVDCYNDSNSFFMLRFMAAARLICGNHYYATLVLFEWLTTFGVLQLFQFFYEKMPGKKNMLLFALLFFPGVSFWTNGMHKEAVALCGLGFLFNGFQKSLAHFSIKNFMRFLTGLFLILYSRNFLLLFLFPGLMAGALCFFKPKFIWPKFVLIYTGFMFFVFSVLPSISSINILEEMAKKQLDFIYLTQSNTNIPISELKPTFSGYLSLVPAALSNCLFHPNFFEVTSPIQWPAAIDNLLFGILALLCFWLVDFKRLNSWLFAMLLCTVLFYYSTIGIIVTNLGALVRYKSLGLFLLLMAFVFIADQNKMNKIFRPHRN